MNPFRWLFAPPTKDQFAKLVISEYRRAGDTREHHYDSDKFMIRHADGGETNLGNLYIEYCREPRRNRKLLLRRIVTGFASVSADLPPDFEDVRADLRPKVWTRGMFANMALQRRLEGQDDADIPLYPLGSHLVTTVVYDRPANMQTLTKDNFETWGVTYYEALEAACENLLETSTTFARVGDGFHSAVSGDFYDSARAVLKDLIATWEVTGDHVAMVPQRDAMFVTGSQDESSLEIMLGLTEATVRDEPRPLSPIPMRLVDGEWEDWMPPTDHPLYSRFKELADQYLGSLYADQKSLLDAIHEKEGTDIFVASYSGVRSETTNQLKTYCVWGQGIDSLLPKTDLLMLGSGGDKVKICKWDDVAKVAGHLMLEEDIYPVRYRVTDFPSDDLIATIDEASL